MRSGGRPLSSRCTLRPRRGISGGRTGGNEGRVGLPSALRDDLHGPLDRDANQRLVLIRPLISGQLPALCREQLLQLFGLMSLNARRRELFGGRKRTVRDLPVVDGAR